MVALNVPDQFDVNPGRVHRPDARHLDPLRNNGSEFPRFHIRVIKFFPQRSEEMCVRINYAVPVAVAFRSRWYFPDADNFGVAELPFGPGWLRPDDGHVEFARKRILGGGDA